MTMDRVMNTKGWLLLIIAGVFLLSGMILDSGTDSFFSRAFGAGKGMSERPLWHTERSEVDVPAYINARTFGGSITVNSHDHNEIEIRIFVRKNGTWLQEGDDAPVEIVVNDTPNGLEINAEPKRRGGLFQRGPSISVSYDILVPPWTEVRASTSGGSVSASDILHNVALITSGGPVTVERVTGEVLARTSGGPITAIDITGDLTARTSGGGIRITDAKGSLLARTSGGPIRLDGVSGAIEANTSGGSIDARILHLEDHLTLSTSGGSIKAVIPRGQGLDIRATGSSVRSRLDDLTGDVSPRSVHGSVHGGGIPVELRTTGGSVQIEYRD